MKKELNYLARRRQSTPREMEAKQELLGMLNFMGEIISGANYLRFNFEDVLPREKIKFLYQLSQQMKKFKKELE